MKEFFDKLNDIKERKLQETNIKKEINLKIKEHLKNSLNSKKEMKMKQIKDEVNVLKMIQKVFILII